MLNVSEQWKEQIYNRPVVLTKAEVDLLTGEKLYLDYEDTDHDFMATGITLQDGTTSDSSFNIGTAIMNVFSFSLNNMDGKFTDKIFSGSTITPYFGYKLEDGTVEWIKKGVFNIASGDSNQPKLSFQAYDNMSKLELPFSAVEITYPATLGQIAKAICDYCGVEIEKEDFDNASYVVNSAPIGTDYSCRKIISYIAQISGSFARFNSEGRLEIKWYADEVLQEIPVYKAIEPEIKDVTITGIQVSSYYNEDSLTEGENENIETTLAGVDGFVLTVSQNPLIPYGKSAEVASYLGAKINGTTFSSIKVTTFYDPSLEAGDRVSIRDVNDNVYVFFITNLSASIGSYVKLSCVSETEQENTANQYSNSSNAIVRVLDVVNAKIQNLVAVHLEAEVAEIGFLKVKDAEANYVKTNELEAIKADVEEAVISVARIEFATVVDLQAESSRITILENEKLSTEDLTAEVAKLGYVESDQLNALVANLGYVTVKELEAIDGKINNLESIAITTENIEAHIAEFDYLTAKDANLLYASIDFANVEKATIGKVLADIGLITTATIVEGHVTGYLDSVSVNANDITVGTLSVERLIITGSDQSIIYALNNSGDLISTNVDTLDGDVITKRTVTADHLVAGTITSNELHVAEIFGNEANIAYLVASDVFAEAVATHSLVVSTNDLATAAKDTADSAYNLATTANEQANQAIADAENAQKEAEDAALAAVKAQTDADNAAQEAVVAQNLANQAQSDADAAAQAATIAQNTADTAKDNAATAQTRADEAAQAAADAQAVADDATAQAKEAQKVADQAAEDLVTANANLKTAQEDLDAAEAKLVSVTNRVGATETDIAEAQAAVTEAQRTADDAQTAADNAALAATNAQTAADEAVNKANTAQNAADAAKEDAENAQSTATTATNLANAAQADADAAAQAAYKAQSTADTAETNADNAKIAADNAQVVADNAQAAANQANDNAAIAQSTADEAVLAANTANTVLADWCYKNDTTYIDGANIYTGTITADKIDVEDLFAQNITASGTITGATLRGATGDFSGSIIATSGNIGNCAIQDDGSIYAWIQNGSGTLDFRIFDKANLRGLSLYESTQVVNKELFYVDWLGNVLTQDLKVNGELGLEDRLSIYSEVYTGTMLEIYGTSTYEATGNLDFNDSDQVYQVHFDAGSCYNVDMPFVFDAGVYVNGNIESNSIIKGVDILTGEDISLTELHNTVTELNTNIGKYYNITGSNISVEYGVATCLCELTLPAGSYILQGSASFDADSVGDRRLTINTTKAVAATRGTTTQCAPSPVRHTVIQAHSFVRPTKETTYYCMVDHSGSGAITARGQLRAFKFV